MFSPLEFSRYLLELVLALRVLTLGCGLQSRLLRIVQSPRVGLFCSFPFETVETGVEI